MISRDVRPVFLAEPGRAATTSPTALSSGSVGEPGEGRRSPSSGSPRYLALDQSATLIGWAIGWPDMTMPAVGTFGLPERTDPAGTRNDSAVLSQVRFFLEWQFTDKDLTHVFYEAIFVGDNNDTALLLAKVVGIIELLCHDHDRTCVEVVPGQWRTTFLGYADSRGLKGTGLPNLKAAAGARCKELGWRVANEHEAEAVGILTWALAQRFPGEARRLDNSPLFRGRG